MRVSEAEAEADEAEREEVAEASRAAQIKPELGPQSPRGKTPSQACFDLPFPFSFPSPF